MDTSESFYKTTDGGKTWTYLSSLKLLTQYNGVFSYHAPPYRKQKLVFKDSLNGFFTHFSSEYFYKTSDGGLSWQTVNINNQEIHDFDILDSMIIAVSNSGVICTSYDLGQNWTYFSPQLGNLTVPPIFRTPEIHTFTSVHIFDKNTHLVAGLQGSRDPSNSFPEETTLLMTRIKTSIKTNTKCTKSNKNLSKPNF